MSAIRTEAILLDCARAWHDLDADAASRLVARLPSLTADGDLRAVAAEACLAIAMVAWRIDRDIERASHFVDRGLGLVSADAAPWPWMRLMNFSIFASLEQGDWVDVIPMALAVRRRAAQIPLAQEEALQATNNMAWVLWQLGDLDAAEALMREAALAGPPSVQSGQALGGLIALLVHRGNVDEAASLLERLREAPLRDQRRVEVLTTAEARVALAQGRTQEALDKARQGLALGMALSEDAAALFVVATEASRLLGHPRAALEYAERGFAETNEQVAIQERSDLLLAYGRAAHDAGRHDLTLKALEDLRQLRTDRGHQSVTVGLSRVLTQLEDRVYRLETVELEARSRSLERANAELEASRLRAEAALAERSRLERAFKQTAMLEAAGLMAGGLAQDVNNLLTVVYDAAHGLREKVGSSREHLDNLSAAADEASSLVRRLLRLTRQSLAERKLVPVAPHLRRCEDVLRRLLPTSLQLQVLSDVSGSVLIDPAELEQVIVNLVLNASQAAGRRGQVSVVAREVTDHGGERLIEIAVQDNGPGVAPELRERVFEPFFSTDSSGGSGLGLPVSRSIVESADGTLGLDAGYAGGARFVVRLPFQAGAPAPATSPAARAQAADAPRRLLLVEDEPMVRATLARQLKRAGYTVVTAEDGAAGLDAWRAGRGGFQVVLTDVVMPRMSGTELVRAILDDDPELPIVIMSGYTARANVRDLLERDNVAFLAKPFTPRDLAGRLRQLVGQG